MKKLYLNVFVFLFIFLLFSGFPVKAQAAGYSETKTNKIYIYPCKGEYYYEKFDLSGYIPNFSLTKVSGFGADGDEGNRLSAKYGIGYSASVQEITLFGLPTATGFQQFSYAIFIDNIRYLFQFQVTVIDPIRYEFEDYAYVGNPYSKKFAFSDFLSSFNLDGLEGGVVSLENLYKIKNEYGLTVENNIDYIEVSGTPSKIGEINNKGWVFCFLGKYYVFSLKLKVTVPPIDKVELKLSDVVISNGTIKSDKPLKQLKVTPQTAGITVNDTGWTENGATILQTVWNIYPPDNYKFRAYINYVLKLTIDCNPDSFFSEDTKVYVNGIKMNFSYLGIGRQRLMISSPVFMGLCDHVYGEWEYDSLYHYKVCQSCGDKTANEPHKWDAGTVSGDKKIYECTVCHAKRTVGMDDMKIAEVVLDFGNIFSQNEAKCRLVAGNNEIAGLSVTYAKKGSVGYATLDEPVVYASNSSYKAYIKLTANPGFIFDEETTKVYFIVNGKKGLCTVVNVSSGAAEWGCTFDSVSKPFFTAVFPERLKEKQDLVQFSTGFQILYANNAYSMGTPVKKGVAVIKLNDEILLTNGFDDGTWQYSDINDYLSKNGITSEAEKKKTIDKLSAKCQNLYVCTFAPDLSSGEYKVLTLDDTEMIKKSGGAYASVMRVFEDVSGLATYYAQGKYLKSIEVTGIVPQLGDFLLDTVNDTVVVKWDNTAQIACGDKRTVTYTVHPYYYGMEFNEETVVIFNAEPIKSKLVDSTTITFSINYEFNHDIAQNTKESDCEYDGFTEKYCKLCGTVFSKDVIKATGHKLKEIKGSAGNCITESVPGYFICENCNQMFSDSLGKTPISEVPKGKKDPAVHVDSSSKMFDDKEHWDECLCGAKLNVEAHVFSGDVCEKCGYKRDAVLPTPTEIPATPTPTEASDTPTPTSQIEAPTPTPSEKQTTPTPTGSANDNTEKKNGLPALAWILLAIVLVGSGSFAWYWFCYRKKKADKKSE